MKTLKARIDSLEEAINFLGLDKNDPVGTSRAIADNYDLGKKSDYVTYCNPNETAICYLLMAYQTVVDNNGLWDAYKDIPVNQMAAAYFGDNLID